MRPDEVSNSASTTQPRPTAPFPVTARPGVLAREPALRLAVISALFAVRQTSGIKLRHARTEDVPVVRLLASLPRHVRRTVCCKY